MLTIKTCSTDGSGRRVIADTIFISVVGRSDQSGTVSLTVVRHRLPLAVLAPGFRDEVHALIGHATWSAMDAAAIRSSVPERSFASDGTPVAHATSRNPSFTVGAPNGNSWTLVTTARAAFRRHLDREQSPGQSGTPRSRVNAGSLSSRPQLRAVHVVPPPTRGPTPSRTA